MTPRPLSTFLARLVWLCMAPLLLLALWLAWVSIEEQEARHLREGADQAENFAHAIDQHLRARINALHMLAISPLADDEHRWPELYAEAQGFHQSFGIHVIFADHERQMLFNTRQPYGAKLPRLPDSKGKTAAPLALATGQPQVGDIVISPIDGKLLVAIAVPVLRENQPTRLMLSIFETARFQQRLDQLALPPGWSIALQDGSGADIARRSPPGFDSARDVAADHRFVARSELSPWSVVLEIPRSSHDDQLYRTGAALLFATLLATLLGVLGGGLAGRQLNRQMRLLAEPPGTELPPLQIAEIMTARQELDQAAAELRGSEAHFHTIFDNILDAVVFADPERRIVRVNPAFTRLFGYTAEEVAGRSTEFLYADPADFAEQGHRRYRIASGGDTGTVEMRYRRKDGSEFWAETSGTRVLDRDGAVLGFMGLHRDISARKEAERKEEQARADELRHRDEARLAALNRMADANAARAEAEAAEQEIRRLNADLERRVIERTAELAAANQELESFAYAVSHDLRAPLRAMNGFSQALAEDYGDQLQGEARGYLDQISIASRKMTDLIDGILVLSRSTRGELRRDEVDLSALARRHLDELARVEPARQVKVAVEDGLVARGDGRMLEVVMTNLLDNAWKYTGKAAAPSIRVYRGKLGGEVAAEPGFCVADNGAGFDMAHAERLFKPFQRLHRQEEFAGIGIGLATVQRIIHRHGGEIAAQAAPGTGATFCFTLPDSGDALLGDP